MSTNSLNWKKLSFVENGDNYSICMNYPYDVRNDKTGRILKPQITKQGYARIQLFKNKHQKNYSHHQLIWISHFGEYDKTQYDIDHRDHNRINNHIENLRLVTKSINKINISKRGNIYYEYHDELPDKIVINEEQGIYFCRQLNKFFRRVVDEYRELIEIKYNQKYSYISWRSNSKKQYFNATTFRQTLE